MVRGWGGGWKPPDAWETAGRGGLSRRGVGVVTFGAMTNEGSGRSWQVGGVPVSRRQPLPSFKADGIRINLSGLILGSQSVASLCVIAIRHVQQAAAKPAGVWMGNLQTQTESLSHHLKTRPGSLKFSSDIFQTQPTGAQI